MVGSVMIKVLEERNFQSAELLAVASERSAGRSVSFGGKQIPVISPVQALRQKPDLALFSAGSALSTEWAPQFAQAGCRVIDNSSAWRMDPGKKLVVPEVNGHVLTRDDFIIANPNCSTIQMLLVLFPLEKYYGLKRVVVSTYQSVSGTGAAAVQQLMDERGGRKAEKVYPYPIDLNILPHIDSFTANGYTKEEMKMINESRKIMDLPSLRITATTVRVPVKGGHSESVNIELEKEFELADIRNLLSASPGVSVQDDPEKLEYPMPLFAEGQDAVFVGRIRRDESQPNTLNLWIVADNLRKGAATNAVQIAELLIQKGFISS